MSKQGIDRRQFIAATGAVAAAAGLPQGAGAQAPATPRRGGTLKISVPRRPNHLNPLKHVNESEYMLSELMYSSLTRLGRDMRAIPDLAEAWEANTNATEWRFRLRAARFHDGSEVKARDVVASFRAMRDPAVASAAARNIGPVETVEEVDERTVKITTNVPYADLPVAVAYTNAKILPAAVIERNLSEAETRDFGTGPFKLRSFDPGRNCVVERFDGYFLSGKPYLDAVEQVVYPDANAEVAAFLNRANDLLLEVPQPDFERVRGTAGVDALRTPSGRYPNMVLGCDAPPFNDARVREALALSIDREQVVQLVLEGYGSAAFENPVANSYRFHKATAPRPRNIARARELLAAAGHPNGLDVTLIAANSPTIRERLAVTVRELARPAGFRINVQVMPYDTYLAQVWRRGNFYIGYYNMQPTLDGLFKLLYTSDAAWNETRWNNRAFDELVNQARTTTDDARREALYGQAQELIVRESPAIVPCFMDLLAAKWNHVRDYRHHPRGAVYFLEEVWLAENAPRR